MPGTRPDANTTESSGPSTSQRVFLIGMMGCGKSTIGARLARLLRCSYIDNDEVLVKREGEDLNALADKGAEVLHDAEANLVRSLCALRPPFVAGIPASIADRAAELRLLREEGVLVYLRATPETLARRIAHSGRRPFVGDDPVSWNTAMLALRAPAFEGAAHLVIDTDTLDPDTVAARISAFVAKR